MAYLLRYRQKRLADLNVNPTFSMADLNVNPTFSMADFKAVPKEWRERIPEYVKDYVSLKQLMQSPK